MRLRIPPGLDFGCDKDITTLRGKHVVESILSQP